MKTVTQQLLESYHAEQCGLLTEPCVQCVQDVNVAVSCLLALPLEQRMEAMGMREVNVGSGADPWADDLSGPVPNDKAAYWTESW